MSDQINLSVGKCIQKNESSSGAIVVLYDNLEVKERVDKIWEQVFMYSNKILRAAELYGFVLLPEDTSLDLHAMVFRLHMLTASMQYAIDHGPALGLDNTRINMILNAREQLRRMKRLSGALELNDLNEYSLTIAELEKQAVLAN